MKYFLVWFTVPSLLCAAVCCPEVAEREPINWLEKSAAEQKIIKNVYSHLLIHDSASAVLCARNGVAIYPECQALRYALIRALSEQGEELQALDEWKQLTKGQNSRHLLEVLSWGVLRKGERSSQLVIRINALLGASFTRDARAVPLLIEEMRSSNALLRSLAIHMAANFGDTPLQEELARLLKEEKVWNVKLEVIKAVGQLRMLRTRPQLIEIIGNPKTLVEEKAAAMISLISLYEAVEVQELQQLIRSNRAGLRELACEIVSHLELEEHLPLIEPLLKDTSSHVRISALNAFGLMGKGPCLEQLEDSDPYVAITAGWLALIRDDPKGEETLEKWMFDSNPDLRRISSAAVAASGTRGVNLAWKGIRKSTDPFVRANLSISLMKQRQHVKEASRVLYEVFQGQKEMLMWDQHANPLFRSLAPSRVKHIEQVPNYPLVVDQMVRLDLLSMLSVMRYPKSQEAIKGFLQSQNWGVTGSAVVALIEEGDEEALSMVRELLNDPEQKIRVQAAFILALLGSDPEAVKVLQEAYPNVDREMKVQILEALAHIGAPESIPFLMNILKEPFQVLRVVAASALIQCLNH